MDDDDFDALREAQRDLTLARYRHWIKGAETASSIRFYDEVRIDEYHTVTIGEWGGYLVQIMPMLFNDRLVLTPANCPYVYDYGWCYEKGPAPLLAAWVWDPQTQGEPVGYKKRINLVARRPGERPAEIPIGAQYASSLFGALGIPEIS